MLKSMLLAAAVIAAGTTVASARDRYDRDYEYRGYSRAEAFYRRAASDGRITKDEWRIINHLRAQEAQRGRHYRRSRDW